MCDEAPPVLDNNPAMLKSPANELAQCFDIHTFTAFHVLA